MAKRINNKAKVEKLTIDSLTPAQWNLVAACVDAAQFASGAVEDAAAVKAFIRAVLSDPKRRAALQGQQ